MRRYIRQQVPGGTYFFTAVTRDRRPVFRSEENIERLRAGFRLVMACRPFRLVAIVVLPDHLHCIWTLPDGDCDFSVRWQILKKSVARSVGRSDRPVWQPRFWEHVIRDHRDLHRHLDYVHFNPVKHGLVKRPVDWPYSSFSRFVQAGHYAADWAGGDYAGDSGLELE